MSNWASDLVTTILEKSQGTNNNDRILLGTITSTSPLSIKLFDKVVNRYVYADPTRLAFNNAQIDQAFVGADDIPYSVVSLLKRYMKENLYKAGDTVIVLQRDVSFYILAKVG